MDTATHVDFALHYTSRLLLQQSGVCGADPESPPRSLGSRLWAFLFATTPTAGSGGGSSWDSLRRTSPVR